MNPLTLKLTSLMLAVSLLFTSCATTADGRKTQGQGAALGALLGAGLGVALAAATGDTSQLARAAAIGAAAGGVAGFAYGSQVAKKKAQYATQEEFLDVAIAEASQNHQEAVASNAQLLAEVEALESRYGNVAQTNNINKRTLKRDASVQMASIDKQSQKLDAQIADYNECLTGEGYDSKPQSAVLRTKVQSLQEEKAKLMRSKTRLANAQTRIAI